MIEIWRNASTGFLQFTRSLLHERCGGRVGGKVGGIKSKEGREGWKEQKKSKKMGETIGIILHVFFLRVFFY